jgi:peptidoglycan-N-acetylglucosamine deacetylase
VVIASEGFTFRTNKDDYLTWEQIGELHRDGFEIGNHTRDHIALTKANLPRLTDQVEAINAQCAAHGIPAPTSFAYPGNTIDPAALPMLAGLGFRFGRRRRTRVSIRGRKWRRLRARPRSSAAGAVGR